ncbi:DUF2846 domain-containing protein [Ferrovibrio sp. MS7]|uniref:DUF2846 domain-containing protein n=1 Tax=Ferrovibrio plantarum TaxID=3119164 RepID=UPI003136DAD9
MVLHRSFSILILAALAGCAAATPPGATPSVVQALPADGMARLYLYRTTFTLGAAGGLIGGAAEKPLAVDGRRVTALGNGGSAYCDLPPGRHRVTDMENGGELLVDLTAGQAAYFRLDTGINGLTRQGRVAVVDAASGAAELQGRQPQAITCGG